MRLLIVDDDPDVCEVIIDSMQTFGIHAERACDGLDALEKVALVRYDAALIDYVMPRMNGPTLARELEARYPELPVFMMSGHDSVLDGNADVANVRALFPKPLDLATVVLRIRALLVAS